jgi:3-oxoacyl-[acyl-carrier protein] reductase
MTIPHDEVSAGRVAIVTGGSRGVGRATVHRLVTRGYAAVVNYLHDQRGAESTVEMVLADNGAAVAVRADVADELDVGRLFAETIEAFGGVDVVVHAVGTRIVPTPVAEIDLEQFDALWQINTRATLIVDREAARRLRNGGAIVNLSSSAVDRGLPTCCVPAAISAATDVLTRVLALELRERDITVNTVRPVVDRPCAPNRIADVIAYLLSEEGHGLTGLVVRIDEIGALGLPPVHRDPCFARRPGQASRRMSGIFLARWVTRAATVDFRSRAGCGRWRAAIFGTWPWTAQTERRASLDRSRTSDALVGALIKRTVEQVEIATLEYVDWFNHRRLFQTCGDIPPAELEHAHYRQQAVLAVAGHLNPWSPDSPGFSVDGDVRPCKR